MIERLVFAVSLALQLAGLYAIAHINARTAALVEQLRTITGPWP